MMAQVKDNFCRVSRIEFQVQERGDYLPRIEDGQRVVPVSAQT